MKGCYAGNIQGLYLLISSVKGAMIIQYSYLCLRVFRSWCKQWIVAVGPPVHTWNRLEERLSKVHGQEIGSDSRLFQRIFRARWRNPTLMPKGILLSERNSPMRETGTRKRVAIMENRWLANRRQPGRIRTAPDHYHVQIVALPVLRMEDNFH